MSFLQKGAGFILLPLYTAYLSPEQFGIANVVNASAAIYIMLFSLALDDAVARYYFIYKSEKDKQAFFLGSIVIFSLLISILSLIFQYQFRGFFFNILINDDVPNSLLIYGVLSIATAPLYTIQQKIHIIEERPFHYTINTFSYFLINTLLCILFIVKLQMGAEGLLLAATIVNVIFYLYSFFFLSKRIKYSLKYKYLKEALKYSLPLLPNRISSWGLDNFNKVYIGQVLTNAAVGIFNVASYFGLLVTVIAQSVSMAYQPFVFKLLDEGVIGKEKLKNIIIFLSMCYTITGFVIAIIAKYILLLFINQRYESAVTIIPVIVWGATLSAISTSYIYILFYYIRAPKHISISTILSAAVNVICCIVFIPKYGLSGAVFALFVSTIVSVLYKYYFAVKVSDIKINFFKIFVPPVILIAITFFISNYEIHIAAIIGIIIFFLFCYLFINLKEIKYIYKYLSK